MEEGCQKGKEKEAICQNKTPSLLLGASLGTREKVFLGLRRKKGLLLIKVAIQPLAFTSLSGG
jgi:hypothetical protein